MWFKNLRLFRLSPDFSLKPDALETALSTQTYHPGSQLETESMGWTAPVGDGPLVYALDGNYLISLRTNKKLLPATVIRQMTQARAQDIEEQQGYRPGRRQLREIKEQVTDELLPQAFSIYRDTRVWIDSRHHWVVVDAASAARSDDVMRLLSQAISPFPIRPLALQQAPASAMTEWLIAGEAPDGFTIDQEAELRCNSEERATVRFVRHHIALEDVRRHIESGKQCTKLALTWADRLSFVLTEGMEVKRLVALDQIKEELAAQEPNEAEAFDADFTLMTGELAQLLDALINTLGEETSP